MTAGMRMRNFFWFTVGVVTGVMSLCAYAMYWAKARTKIASLRCPYCDKRFTCRHGETDAAIQYHQEFDCPEYESEMD